MTSPNTYLVGQPIELLDLIENPRSTPTPYAPVDDSTDTVTVYLPDGTNVTISGTHGVTGEYSAVFIPTLPYWHEYVWSSTTTGAGKGRGRFYVSPVP